MVRRGRRAATSPSSRRAPTSTRRSRHGAAVPVGSIVDATAGTVRLTSEAATTRRTSSCATAKFEVRQATDGSGITELVLRGGNFSSCGRAQSARRRRQAAAAPVAVGARPRRQVPHARAQQRRDRPRHDVAHDRHLPRHDDDRLLRAPSRCASCAPAARLVVRKGQHGTWRPPAPLTASRRSKLHAHVPSPRPDVPRAHASLAAHAAHRAAHLGAPARRSDAARPPPARAARARRRRTGVTPRSAAICAPSCARSTSARLGRDLVRLRSLKK